MKLRSIREIAFDSQERRVRSGNRYFSNILESMGSEFPIEPDDNIWKKRYDSGKSVKLSYDLSDRENLKDFISSVQELEDRMQFFSRMQIEKYSVTIECDVSSTAAISENVKKFLEAVDSIKENIDGK